MPMFPRSLSLLAVGVPAALALAAPSAAETVSTAEAQRVLAAMPDVVSARPADLQYAMAPSCGSPCAPCASPCAPPCPDPCANPCWERCTRFHVSVGAWAWGFDGSIGDDDDDFDIDGDWLDDLEIALDARLRVERGRWSATLNVSGGDIESDAEGDDFDSDAELSTWIVQGQIGFGLFGGSLGCGPCAPVGCVEIYAGARAWFVEREVDLDPGSTIGLSLEGEEQWVDPIIGLRGELHIRERWSFILEGDVGGFGVGSEFTWHVLGTVNFHIGKHFSIYAGWKVIDIDYDDNDFIWDLTLSGPVAGITVSF